MSIIGSVALAILILLVMVCVHEFGHYAAGKALGFKINEFAIGFGPAVFKRTSKKTGEKFSVRVFPLGGFCAFEGEDGEEEKEAESVHKTESADGSVQTAGGSVQTAGADEAMGAGGRSFTEMPPWKRIIVLLAGPLMNYVLALLLITVSMFAFGRMVFRIGGVAPYEGENAEIYSQYCFCEGDDILEAEGKKIYLTTDLMTALRGKKEGERAAFAVLRGGERVEIEVMLRDDCDFTSSSQTSALWRALGVGVYTGDDGKAYYSLGVDSVKEGFWQTVGSSFAYSARIAGTIFKVLGELLTGHLGLDAMGGPVTTIKLTSQVASKSLQNFFEIAAYIGVNLAVFNLLPIPALDGSKVVFCLIEWIFRKPVPRKVEAIIHAVGFVLILGFAVLVDILQFIP